MSRLPGTTPSPGTRGLPARAPRDILWIAAAALALKGAVLLQLGAHPLLQPHGDLDTARYVELAQQVATAGPLSVPEPFYLSPLYVYFLAAVFSLGGGLWAARLVQILLGAGAVVLTYLVGRDWFGVGTGRVAALLLLLSGFVTFSEILILQSALDPLLTAAALYFASRTQLTDRRWPLLAAGAALGLLSLNRPNATVYALTAVVLVGLAASRVSRSAPDPAPRRLGPAFQRAAILFLSLAAVVGLNGLRNYLASGELILISSHGGLNFYIGNNEGATGIYSPVPGVTPSVSGQVRDATRLAEAARGRSLTRSEVSQYFYAQAWNWIETHPTRALKLFARKLAILFNRTDVALNYSYPFYSRDESSALRYLIVAPLLLLPLGLVGLVIGSSRVPALEPSAHANERSRLRYWAWASFVPVYGVSVAAFFVSDRYRLPLLVSMSVFAAYTLNWTAEVARQRRFRSLPLALAAVVVATIFSAWDLGLDDGRGGERVRKAEWLIREGSYQDARSYIATASDGLRHPGVFHFKVGEALTAAGHYDDAVLELRTALAIDRGQPAIQLALGQALMMSGRAADAVPPLRAALDATFRPEVSGPWLVRALAAEGSRGEAIRVLSTLSDDLIAAAGSATATEMGSLALELQEPVHAERWLRDAAVHAPESAEAHEKLAVSLLLQGRAAEALAPIERACHLAPSSASARLNLAVTYAQLGRLTDARAAAGDAVRLDPSEPRAVALLEALKKRETGPR